MYFDYYLSLSAYLFDAVVELVTAEAVHDGGGLEEDAPEERHATRRVEVHELEQVRVEKRS